MISGISGYGSSLPTLPVQSQQTSPRLSTEEFLSAIDSNQDGTVDRAEFTTFDEMMQSQSGETPGVDEFFNNYDTNGDGRVSKDEMSTAESPTHAHGGGRPRGGPGGPQGGGGVNGAGEESSSTTGTDPADLNGDGVVTLSEYLASLMANSTNANSGDAIKIVGSQDPSYNSATSRDSVLQAYSASSYRNGVSSSLFDAIG